MPSSSIFYLNYSYPTILENEPMKDHERAVLMTTMFDAGVVPLTQAETGFDMKRILAQLPHEEAHKLKRKFRKLWRKLAKSETKLGDSNKMKRLYGAGEVNPSRNARKNRKQLVLRHFINDVVKPMIKQFETGPAIENRLDVKT
jgi:hypothetical protein